MSLILDALAKSEREKQAQEAPAPDVLALQAEPAQAARAGLWAWLAGAALLVSLAVLALLLRGGGGGGDSDSDGKNALRSAPAGGDARPQRAAPAGRGGDLANAPATPSMTAAQPGRSAESRLASPAAAGITPAPAALPAGSTVAAPPRTLTPAMPDGTPVVPEQRRDGASRDVQALYEQSAVAAAGTRPTRPGAPPDGPQSAAPVPARVATDAGAAEPRAATEVPTETPLDVAEVLREVDSIVGELGLEPHPTPMLSTLSKQFRDSLPTLMYQRHDFNSAGVSTVRISGQALRVGQRVRGVEVLDILPDSVILQFEGTRFRLRALNSWVNL